MVEVLSTSPGALRIMGTDDSLCGRSDPVSDGGGPAASAARHRASMPLPLASSQRRSDVVFAEDRVSRMVVLIAPSSCEAIASAIYRDLAARAHRVWWERVDLSPDDRLRRLSSVPDPPPRLTSYRMARFEAINNATALVLIAGRGMQQLQLRDEFNSVRMNSVFKKIIVLTGSYRLSDVALWMQPAHLIQARRYAPHVAEAIHALLTSDDRTEPIAPRRRVFLCHAHEDSDRVRRIFSFLGAHGLDPWFDKANLSAGDRFEDEIQHAIDESELFVAFLSSKSIHKRGFVQQELRMAATHYRTLPDGLPYFIPVKLDDCEVPPIRLDDITTLSEFQWIDTFNDSQETHDRLLTHLRRQLARLDIARQASARVIQRR